LQTRKTAVPLRGRAAQGERTRQAILEVAVHLASAEGLEGLTIGRLATKLAMSKSGLFAHFGSKEELQLATIETARSIFVREVIHPALEAGQGLARLGTFVISGSAMCSEKFSRGAASSQRRRPNSIAGRAWSGTG